MCNSIVTCQGSFEIKAHKQQYLLFCLKPSWTSIGGLSSHGRVCSLLYLVGEGTGSVLRLSDVHYHND